MPKFPFILLAAVLAACKPLAPAGNSNVAEPTTESAPSPRPIAQPGSPAPGIFGRDWVFVELDGYDGPLPSPPPVAGFNITREGSRVTGTTACNRIGAGFQIDEGSGRLRFTNLRNTRMMCDRVAADTEEAVLSAMIATDSFRLDGNRLELLSKGKTVARLESRD